MRLEEFDYVLPPGRIAQQPLAARDGARMLRLDRHNGALADAAFADLPEILRPGDLLVANDSRVFPARLLGRRQGHPDGVVEVLLLREVEPGVWDALARPGRKLPPGTVLEFTGAAATLTAEIVAVGPRGERRLRFHPHPDFWAALDRLGHVPLPPYITRPDAAADRDRYQTVFASQPGSAAAPTAGLHFTPQMIARLTARGIQWTTVCLHVGLGTFQSVTAEHIEQHTMHRESFSISAPAATTLNRARAEGRRIIAVGTTAARTLESATLPFAPKSGDTGIFLYPGGPPFRVVDGLLTNFHAPRTSLLMMVAALAGTPAIQRAYQHALDQGYRFLSYGDCMLIS